MRGSLRPSEKERERKKSLENEKESVPEKKCNGSSARLGIRELVGNGVRVQAPIPVPVLIQAQGSVAARGRVRARVRVEVR